MDQICTSKLMVIMMGFTVLTSIAVRAINSSQFPPPRPFSYSSINPPSNLSPLGSNNNPLQPSIFDGVFKKFQGVRFVLCVYKLLFYV